MTEKDKIIYIKDMGFDNSDICNAVEILEMVDNEKDPIDKFYQIAKEVADNNLNHYYIVVRMLIIQELVKGRIHV